MTIPAETSSFALGIHAMPCTNHCQHCRTEGSPRHPRMPAQQIFFVLEKPAELRERLSQVPFLLHGDRDNDELDWLNDLPENKWAARYLLDC